MLSAALGAVAPVSSERLRREETLRLACGLPFFIPEAREDRRPWRLSFTGKKKKSISQIENLQIIPMSCWRVDDALFLSRLMILTGIRIRKIMLLEARKVKLKGLYG